MNGGKWFREPLSYISLVPGRIFTSRCASLLYVINVSLTKCVQIKIHDKIPTNFIMNFYLCPICSKNFIFVELRLKIQIPPSHEEGIC